MIRYIQALDHKTFYSVFEYTSQTSLTKIARQLSRSADGWLYLLLPLLAWLYKTDDTISLVIAGTAGFIIERTLYFILKNTIKRRRPYKALDNFSSLIIASDEFSLPSGHTSAAFFAVTFLCAGVSLVFLPLYLWAACVGMSRVVLGVHFISDVIVGAMIGGSIGLLVL